MSLKDVLFAFVAIAFLTFSFEAQANYNPHHRLTIAMENGVRQMNGGSELIEQARSRGLDLLLFHCFVVNEENEKVCENDFVYNREEGQILFHADFHGSASFEELSNLVYEALLGF